MLEHELTKPSLPARVVILGHTGVIGRALDDSLRADHVSVVGLSSRDIDLLGDGAADKLSNILEPGDCVVLLSAWTPDRGRDIATFMKNLQMVENVCSALRKKPVAQVIYLSSDAVYPMSLGLINEETPAQPQDLYGTMHYAREVMLRDTIKEAALAIVRCTLVLSHRDSHNSYGPNRFRRAAAEKAEIVLGGEGEETRDHVYDVDVADLIKLVIAHRSRGILNLATGTSYSFREVAEMVKACSKIQVSIKGSSRSGAITHRHFDVTAVHRAFPAFHFTPLAEAIRMVQAEAIV